MQLLQWNVIFVWVSWGKAYKNVLPLFTHISLMESWYPVGKSKISWVCLCLLVISGMLISLWSGDICLHRKMGKNKQTLFAFIWNLLIVKILYHDSDIMVGTLLPLSDFCWFQLKGLEFWYYLHLCFDWVILHITWGLSSTHCVVSLVSKAGSLSCSLKVMHLSRSCFSTQV